jgi:plastocyanin
MKPKFLMLAVTLCASSSFAADHLVSQTGKAFSTKALSAKVGDTLSFRNEDPFVHNIFSLSDAQSFDLGTFAKGEVRSVKLQSSGKLEIECAVHPEMRLTVEVAK